MFLEWSGERWFFWWCKRASERSVDVPVTPRNFLFHERAFVQLPRGRAYEILAGIDLFSTKH
ncbi:hypothetical protein A9C19_01245 [Bacillus weihaiensis]|uniref:Uncharacterized protein n=1 Tax=Bacillus weihaiensis TaxID=1547283 RepID=A0A1L3MMA4_9BACI|nr:hypothetical protein A9C19_01245 [Bacillus weihaiensis]